MKCIMQSDRNLSTDYRIKAPCLTDAIKQMLLQIMVSKGRRLDVKLTYLSSWSAHKVSLSTSHASGAAFGKQCWLFPAKEKEKKKKKRNKYYKSNTAIHPDKKKCMLPVLQNGGQKAAFANADVHPSANKCRVSRKLDSHGRKSLAASW